jgi:DNA-binding MarR family transcriptional regulator
MLNEVPPAQLTELELDAWRGFLRTHSELVRELDEELMAQHSLPLSSYDVLVQLDEADGGAMRLAQLADAVLISRSGLTRLVQRLIDQGLVKREDCESDARGAFAVITDEGRRRLDEARVTHRAGVHRRFLDQLTEAQQRQLGAIWSKLLAG